jgi:anti-sigma regulatory factor (Ser/Thr protein kinase)
MSQATQRKRMTILPGTAEAPRRAREFIVAVLGPGQDDVLLVVVELVTNSVRHSRSGGPGGQVTVTVEPGPEGQVLIEVTDAGPAAGSRPPASAVMPGAGSLPEGGMGLALVGELSAEWGCDPVPGSTRYWARMRVAA